ncbi:polysaccharide biosynthesis/export family protein [Silvibacterium sp.]|uniref:polysaccharide biosynthesis/export family protein n=1 Tax=Silvibacterium sp. TaxID=1964179 RepID=UPI0039E6E46B
MSTLSHLPQSIRQTALLLVLPAALLSGAYAQQSAGTAPATANSAASAGPNAGEPADPQLKLSPEKLLKDFEPAANAEYELGPGDDITITIPGHPELNGKQTVGPDGRITLQSVGAIDVNNKTRLGAGEAIRTALTPYYTDVLQVTVAIDKYGSNHVTVLGNVKNPGQISFDDTPTLMGAISKAGLSASATSKDGIPDNCTVYYHAPSGEDVKVDVDLRQLIETGSPLINMRLHRNDIVFVPVQKQRVISVLGSVRNPGPVQLTPDLSLHLALSEAGGLTEDAGKNIYIISGMTGKKTLISFKDMMKPNGDKEIALHEGDTIYIPRSGFSKVGSVMQKLGPAATIVEIGALL